MLTGQLKETLLGWVAPPAEHRAALEDARRRRFTNLAPLASVYGLFASLVLTLAFWGHSSMPIVVLWSLAGAVATYVRFREKVSLRKNPSNGAGVDKAIVRHTLISGLAWGVLVASLFVTGEPEHRPLLTMLVAGVLCVGAFLNSSYPGASLGFSIAVSCGAVAGIFLTEQPRAFEMTLLLAGCVLAIQRSAAMNAASLMRRLLSDIALRESDETVRLLLHDFETQASDWLWRADPAGRIVQPSKRFAEAADMASETLEGAAFLALFSPEAAAQIEALMSERRAFRDVALKASIHGEERWWSVSGQPTSDGGYRGVCSDITRHRDAEARIAYFTDFDSLTGLPNRSMLVREIEQAQATAGADGSSYALLQIDLDNFKAVNDTMGHPVGDAYLKMISRRIVDCVGPEAFIARLGGDEFAVLVRNTNRESAHDLCDLVVDSLLAPVGVGGREILSSGSVGVAMGPEDGAQPGDLMKNAELALYRAKAQGRGCARFFEASMDEDARWRADLEADLRLALAHDTMDLYFQPMVHTRSRKVSGYETLLRWNRPGHGLVSPAVFISCAEETGFIVPLGEWVIRKAIEEAAQWKDEVSVAVNLSPAQIRNPSIVSTVVTALASSQIDPGRLEIEITESVLLEETDQTLRTLHALRAVGVKIALDDFGTGYSSLSYLRSFPFDKIKIDQRFVRDIDTSPENQAIVRSVISLARDLGMAVTAEGVEDEQQAAILAAFGCLEVQGYLYSRPVPACEIEKHENPASRLGAESSAGTRLYMIR